MCQVEFTMSRCMAPATNLHIEVWLNRLNMIRLPKPVPNMIQIESLLLKTIHFLVFPRAPINTTVCKNEARQPCRGWLYPNSNCCQNICRIALDLRLTSHGFLWVFPKFPSHCQEYEKLLEQVRPFGKDLALETLRRGENGRPAIVTWWQLRVFGEGLGTSSPQLGWFNESFWGCSWMRSPKTGCRCLFLGCFWRSFCKCRVQTSSQLMVAS